MDQLNSIMEGTEEKISELKDGTIKFTQSEQHRENRLKKINSFRDLWDYSKRGNILLSESLKVRRKRVWLKK